MSQAKISKWPNTIHAERERKEAERIRKLEDDEVSTNLLESSLFQTHNPAYSFFLWMLSQFQIYQLYFILPFFID
jgi:hypothetical protein